MKSIGTLFSTGFVLLYSCFGCLAQYTNGIYAEFNTSMGSFTCRLDHVLAPIACANFMGLATGTRPWLDARSGLAKTNPYFNGTIFHRVATGFVNQAGTRNGVSSEGPGYTFTDEFTTLKHQGFGVLSMANSGPDSNGSQFFITMVTRTNLDNVHTVFGHVYGGSNVVYAINQVATTNERPLTNVVINNVVIQRVGAAAQAFDVHAQGLPWVTDVSLNIQNVVTNLILTYSNQIYADNRLYASTNLVTWQGQNRGIETASPVSTTIPVSPLAAAAFFRLVQIQYPPAVYTPRNVLDHTLTINFSGGAILVAAFNSVGTGTYTFNGGAPQNIVGYTWIQDAYRGRFRPLVLQNFNSVLELHLDYDAASSGTFKGTAFPFYPLTLGATPVSGSFSSVP
jgi:cyclophilin family peptidyl-prolyl cis-trans isomerase